MRHLTFKYKGKRITDNDLSILVHRHPYACSHGIEIPLDIIDVIIDLITNSHVFKKVLFLCRRVYDNHRNKISNHCNVLWTLINRYAENDWDRYAVWKNPNTSLSMIRNMTSEHTNSQFWRCISYNSNITTQFIEENIKKKWCWYGLSYNKNITPEFVRKYNTKNWDKFIIYQHLYHNKVVYNDNYSGPNITIEYIRQNYDCIDFYSWGNISKNPVISMQDIMDNPNFEWRWDYVSQNPNLTPAFIENNLDKYWDWNFIYMYNPYITLEFIEKYLHIQQNAKVEMWISLSHNKCITIDIYRKHHDKPWKWDIVFSHTPYYEELIAKHLIKTRVWSEQHAVWSNIFSNPHISLQFCEKHLDKIHAYGWDIIYVNKFGM